MIKIQKMQNILKKVIILSVFVFIIIPNVSFAVPIGSPTGASPSIQPAQKNDPAGAGTSSQIPGATNSPDPDGSGASVQPQNATGDSKQPPQSFTLSNPLKVNSVSELVQNFIEIFSYIAILFAVLMLIWVGFSFVLARGDPAKMNELKNWLMYIVIGVAVIIGARIIIQVVVSTLSSTGTIDPKVIQSVDKAIKGR